MLMILPIVLLNFNMITFTLLTSSILLIFLFMSTNCETFPTNYSLILFTDQLSLILILLSLMTMILIMIVGIWSHKL